MTQPKALQLADALEQTVDYDFNRYVCKAVEELRRLHQICRNVYEVWAGSEGIPIPETCLEGYLLTLIEQMRDEAKEGLK